jgi:hypothetical protein
MCRRYDHPIAYTQKLRSRASAKALRAWPTVASGSRCLYPAYTGVCTTVGRKPNLGVKVVGASIARVAVGRIGGIPLSMLSGGAATAGVALTLAPANVEPTWLNSGAATAQLWGTERVPSEAVRPMPAVT